MHVAILLFAHDVSSYGFKFDRAIIERLYSNGYSERDHFQPGTDSFEAREKDVETLEPDARSSQSSEAMDSDSKC
jgi:hypothetical protein